MRSQPISSYIYFGLSWRYLQDARPGIPIHEAGHVVPNLTTILADLETLQLNVTLRAASDLIGFRDHLNTLPAGSTLTVDQADYLTRRLRDLQLTLNAESSGSFAYIVTDKRLDLNKLLGRPYDLFAPGVFKLLPEISRYDFKEAGLCTAFERPTAAAFHLLRGTEGVLRSFYYRLVKRNRLAPPLLWGPMVDALRKLRKPPPAELLNNLDNIRNSFRNPTQHPEKIYDIQEVQDLFGLCVDVVNRMSRGIA